VRFLCVVRRTDTCPSHAHSAVLQAQRVGRPAISVHPLYELLNVRPIALTLSLSLSHTHTHTHFLCLSLCLSVSLSLSLSLSVSLCLSLSLSLSLEDSIQAACPRVLPLIRLLTCVPVRLFRLGNFCPFCLIVYRSNDTDLPMVCCDTCDRWIHCGERMCASIGLVCLEGRPFVL
jgi:hypothetical protein